MRTTCTTRPRTKPANSDVEARRLDTRETAMWLWSKALAAAGTPAEVYLRSRGISPTDTVRYLPADPSRYPHAMIVPVGFADEPEPGRLVVPPAAIAGVQLTLLRSDGAGKAECQPNKKRVGRGRGVPIVIAAPNDGLGLVIAEGVEDALSFHVALGLGAWAAGGATFLPALADAVPDYIDIVTVASHPEPDARRRAEQLAGRLMRRGIAAEIQLIDQTREQVGAAA